MEGLPFQYRQDAVRNKRLDIMIDPVQHPARAAQVPGLRDDRGALDQEEAPFVLIPFAGDRMGIRSKGKRDQNPRAAPDLRIPLDPVRLLAEIDWCLSQSLDDQVD